MASSCGLHAHRGTFFVKILEQMSMDILQIIFWAQLQKVLCFLMLLSSTLTFFQPTQPKKGNNKLESQGLTPSSQDRACEMRRGGWGCASILSVMHNAAPNSYICQKSFLQSYACCFFRYLCCLSLSIIHFLEKKRRGNKAKNEW